MSLMVKIKASTNIFRVREEGEGGYFSHISERPVIREIGLNQAHSLFNSAFVPYLPAYTGKGHMNVENTTW
jgi:hypothetical protein